MKPEWHVNRMRTAARATEPVRPGSWRHVLAGMVMVAIPQLLAADSAAAAPADTFIVIDGDTFEWRGQRVRIANIDAPEVRSAKCDAEHRLGVVASRRLGELLRGGKVKVIPGDPGTGRQHDRHGRMLAVITVDGADLGQIMITEGFVRPWGGSRRNWC